MRALQSNLRKGKVKNLCFRYRNLDLPLTSANTLVATGSPDRLLARLRNHTLKPKADDNIKFSID